MIQMMDGMPGGVMGFLWPLLVIGLGALTVWVVLKLFPSGSESPEEIARKRLARGEITSEEYRAL